MKVSDFAAHTSARLLKPSQLATDHISAFEKLISAYAQIAENLPRFDRLSTALRTHPDFQQVIAVVYSDILEFHRQAYKFFRRTGKRPLLLLLSDRADHYRRLEVLLQILLGSVRSEIQVHTGEPGEAR
jgi:hypothetical protein